MYIFLIVYNYFYQEKHQNVKLESPTEKQLSIMYDDVSRIYHLESCRGVFTPFFVEEFCGIMQLYCIMRKP